MSLWDRKEAAGFFRASILCASLDRREIRIDGVMPNPAEYLSADFSRMMITDFGSKTGWVHGVARGNVGASCLGSRPIKVGRVLKKR